MAIKNKKINYLLLPIVVLIWGMAIFRLLGGKDIDENMGNNGPALDLMKGGEDRDTFQLILNYRDPFLSQPTRKTPVLSSVGRISYSRSQRTSPSAKNNIQIGNIVQKGGNMELPEIRYLGAARQSSSPKLTGILMLDGFSYRVVSGDSLKGFHLLEVQIDQVKLTYRDSIWIVFK